jgi:hypothetical protein
VGKFVERYCVRVYNPHMTKSLSAEQNERARAFTRDLVAKSFEGNASAAARALGVGVGTLADFLRGDKGAGAKLLDAIARFAHVGVDAVIGQPRPDRTSGLLMLRDRAGWDAALDHVRGLMGERFNEQAAAFAGSLSVWVGSEDIEVTPRTALQLYELAVSHLDARAARIRAAGLDPSEHPLRTQATRPKR